MAPEVRAERAGIRRTLAPLLVPELRRALAALPAMLLGLCDRALLLAGWSGAVRRSALVRIDVDELVPVDARHVTGVEGPCRGRRILVVGRLDVWGVPSVLTAPAAWSGAVRRSALVATDVDELVPVVDRTRPPRDRRRGSVQGAPHPRRWTSGRLGRSERSDGPRGLVRRRSPLRARGDRRRRARLRRRQRAITVRCYKTDRHGKLRGERLSDRAVALVVKRAAARVGLDAEVLAGHSLRAGFATSAARAGRPDRDIMRQTGHRSRAVFDRYVREAEVWRDNPANGLL